MRGQVEALWPRPPDPARTAGVGCSIGGFPPSLLIGSARAMLLSPSEPVSRERKAPHSSPPTVLAGAGARTGDGALLFPPSTLLLPWAAVEMGEEGTEKRFSAGFPSPCSWQQWDGGICLATNQAWTADQLGSASFLPVWHNRRHA